MLVDFNALPEESRIWLYQCNRTFTEDEVQEIKEALNEFIVSWTAHGKGLQASYKVVYKRFIVIALDQHVNAATGCSIDASVHFIQDLETKYKVDLLDKMNVSFKQGEFIAYKNLKDFRQMIKNKSVNSKTIVFN
ncbi:MAG: ABC transporter ATPase, partial [Bacteroidota bacterium]